MGILHNFREFLLYLTVRYCFLGNGTVLGRHPRYIFAGGFSLNNPSVTLREPPLLTQWRLSFWGLLNPYVYLNTKQKTEKPRLLRFYSYSIFASSSMLLVSKCMGMGAASSAA